MPISEKTTKRNFNPQDRPEDVYFALLDGRESDSSCRTFQTFKDFNSALDFCKNASTKQLEPFRIDRIRPSASGVSIKNLARGNVHHNIVSFTPDGKGITENTLGNYKDKIDKRILQCPVGFTQVIQVPDGQGGFRYKAMYPNQYNTIGFQYEPTDRYFPKNIELNSKNSRFMTKNKK